MEEEGQLTETSVLDKVGNAISSIHDANHVDEVILALYSLAACLFPLQPTSLSGCLDEKYRDKLWTVEVNSEQERTQWRNVFYKGSAFRALSRVLLYDIALNWLSCFPTSARQCVFDVFFLNGCASEVVLVLVPCLQQRGGGSYDNKAVCSNAERLIVLCLLENDMVLQTANEFTKKCLSEDASHEELKDTISRVAQLITCIPDKVRRGAPVSLSPHLFFKRIIAQLLRGLEVWELELVAKSVVANGSHLSGAVSFIGEVFSRICRRGSADVLLSEVIPQILGRVRSILSTTSDLDISELFESKPFYQMWSKIIEAVNDSHSVERIAEELLNQLAVVCVNDVEGYWTLWILFGQICKSQPSIRFIFVEKCLLWKEFPICSLRWILYFAVLECPPDCPPERNHYNARILSETVQRLLVAWSKEEFVQSCSTEKQSYVTAALGLCLEKMTKEVLDTTKESLPLILQGISCRLESPVYLIRKMASSIALVFSKIIDPQNPLYLDEECHEDSIDWEFGLATQSNETLAITDRNAQQNPDARETCTIASGNETHNIHNGIIITSEDKKEIISNLHDPEEVIDPASLIDESSFNEDDSGCDSEDSETSSNSSLQPYDLADDDTDLKKKFSQLVDVVGALRKSDDAVGVENALDVAETLIRALPDELKYVAGDLAKTLVQVRCFDSTIEGEEDLAEEKRQKALVALVVACPVETLNSLNQLIYSPNLDISQRIMIFDVMTCAAEELASTRVLKSERRHKPLITSNSDQPWFIPRNIGPPGAGSWKEISSTGTPLNWSYSYERELPSKAEKKGKTRRWSLRSGVQGNQTEGSQNLFPQYAAAFMLPVMQGFDKKRHGVDLLGRDFVVLGKLIYMLGVCMKCAAMHPEASVLASPLLDMLKSREICHHREAYVRKSVLFAGSCVLVALHPTYVASAVQGNTEMSEGLEWIRTWALQVAESDTDRECHTLAMTCLHLHAEMALQASRALGSTYDNSSANNISLFPSASKRSIQIPYLNS